MNIIEYITVSDTQRRLQYKEFNSNIKKEVRKEI